MATNLCNSTEAVLFILKYRNDRQIITNQLDVPVENIIGLAAEESQYGMGRIAKQFNNYFSTHAPAPFQIGSEAPLGNPRIRVAKFPSFLESAYSFAARYGNAVRSKKDPRAFAQGLVDVQFNSGNSANGGRAGFVN